jgi:4-hydroxybenzoate polyprenyltransferase
MMMFAAGYTLTRNVAQAKGDAPIIIVGVITLYLTFFRLRAFDEMKDVDIDNRLHPNRPVQRGIVTLNELAIAAMVAVMIEISLNLMLGRGALILYAALMTFTLLMFKEFFVRDWLRTDIFLYATTHVTALGLCGVYAYLLWPMTTHNPISTTPVVLYGASCYLLGLLFEMTRKMPSTTDERSGVPSFTKRFGTTGAWLLVGVLTITAGLCLLGLTIVKESTPWFSLPTFLMGATIVLIAAIAPKAFSRVPTHRAPQIGSAIITTTLCMIVLLGVVG